MYIVGNLDFETDPRNGYNTTTSTSYVARSLLRGRHLTTSVLLLLLLPSSSTPCYVTRLLRLGHVLTGGKCLCEYDITTGVLAARL